MFMKGSPDALEIGQEVPGCYPEGTGHAGQAVTMELLDALRASLKQVSHLVHAYAISTNNFHCAATYALKVSSP